MPGYFHEIAIDARPRITGGLLANALVLGKRVLDHHLEAAEALGATAAEISIIVDPADAQVFAQSIGERARMTTREPECPILRCDRLYDIARLKTCIRRRRPPEFAVYWVIDSKRALAGVDDEMIRRRIYQPLGRYWALAPASALAKALADTRVRPNHLTIVAALAMLAAAILVARGLETRFEALLAASAMALALVIDTADGRLARLQGSGSRLGRWLDATLDELADMTLHAAIAWAAFRASGHAAWLLIGMVYGMSKYLFFISNTIWNEGVDSTPRSDASAALPSPWSPRGAIHWLGHADVRWHAWIVLAAARGLEYELIAAAIYFPVRFVAGSCRKAGAIHGQA
ncbi:MAG: CDP-alcohol phosphatidyltransferase family protein [Isosphaeraceae bacterium]|nr:CDP-alcohol phosphatidyltransferase family protein [Isosphaeraceae bacterium]